MNNYHGLNGSHRVSHFTETTFWQTAKPYESEPANLSACPNSDARHDDSIQTLRQQLKSLNAWPEAGDTFLELLSQVRGYGATLVPGDYDWLAQVADSAYKGEDIGLLYPSIFQKLLTFPELRERFLQVLHIRSIGV
jgi:hypothetical protein